MLLLFSLYITIGEHKDPYEANLNTTQMEADSENPYSKINHQIQLTCIKYGLGPHAIINTNTTTNKYQVMEKNAWVSESGVSHMIKVSWEHKYWLQISTPWMLEQICLNQKYKCKCVSTPMLSCRSIGTFVVLFVPCGNKVTRLSFEVNKADIYKISKDIGWNVRVFLYKPGWKDNR